MHNTSDGLSIHSGLFVIDVSEYAHFLYSLMLAPSIALLTPLLVTYPIKSPTQSDSEFGLAW